MLADSPGDRKSRSSVVTMRVRATEDHTHLPLPIIMSLLGCRPFLLVAVRATNRRQVIKTLSRVIGSNRNRPTHQLLRHAQNHCPHRHRHHRRLSSSQTNHSSSSSSFTASSTKNRDAGTSTGKWYWHTAASAWTFGVAILVIVSYDTRRSRQQSIKMLPLVVITTEDTDTGEASAALSDFWKRHYPHRSLISVLSMIRRAGLMGKRQSVRAELEDIRLWHHTNGYKGGLVLRDLTKPVFGMDIYFGNVDDELNGGASEKETIASDSSSHTEKRTDWTLEELLQDPTRLERRECYYFYYELKGTGEMQQQIFCRGTTLRADVLTCLQAWMVEDEDLQLKLHRGFRNQADRILEDVLPLLTAPSDRRATVEVCGHSLGGAVASILAAKLKQRGYNVVRVTTVGEPRYCASRKDAQRLLEKFLPKDTLRVESEFDFVTFLPPFGAHVGNKVWIVKDPTTQQPSLRLVARSKDDTTTGSNEWADSVWTNFLAWEILSSNGIPHRIPSYVESLARALE